jgi:hypothetical protein
MRWVPMLLLIALLGACRGAGEPVGPTRSLENAEPYPAGTEPNWSSEDLFFDPSENLVYAVGRALIGSGSLDTCPKDSLLLKKAESVAQDRLIAAGAPRAAVQTAEARLAWFDGLGGLHVVVGVDSPAPAGAKHLAPKGGAGGPASIEAARAAIALELRRSGACRDPKRRAEFPCCGPLNTFCADPRRFDRESPDGTCGCGAFEPCLHDFLCEQRQGEKKCLCRGDNCPCAPMIKCKEGQTCQNGRCF